MNTRDMVLLEPAGWFGLSGALVFHKLELGPLL